MAVNVSYINGLLILLVKNKMELLKKKLIGTRFSLVDNLVFILGRGLFPLLRGSIYLLTRFRDPRNLFFLGKGVNIQHVNHLKFGKNFYIGDYSYINCLSSNGVTVGDNVTIREFSWLQLTSKLSNPGDSISIGSNTYIGPRCNLGAAAPLKIGARCQIGAGVSFIAENHKFDSGSEIFNQGVTRIGISIGNDCWIGNNAIILDGVSVGTGVVIGAGSIVTKNIPDNVVIIGNPARIIKSRDADKNELGF